MSIQYDGLDHASFHRGVERLAAVTYYGQPCRYNELEETVSVYMLHQAILVNLGVDNATHISSWWKQSY